MRSGASVRALLAPQLEKKTSHKHSCYYVILYVLCSMLECFDL